MAKELFKYDPLTGVRTYFDFDDETGEAVLLKEQDATAVVDWATKARNEGRYENAIKADDYGIPYAVIPTIVELELLKKGINIHDPNCTRRLLEEINRNYPHLKLTNKTHVANH